MKTKNRKTNQFRQIFKKKLARLGENPDSIDEKLSGPNPFLLDLASSLINQGPLLYADRDIWV